MKAAGVAVLFLGLAGTLKMLASDQHSAQSQWSHVANYLFACRTLIGRFSILNGL